MHRTLGPAVAVCSRARPQAVPGPGCGSHRPPTPLAPLLTNLGTLHHAITTTNPRAQTFFDQGLRLVYGFNHAEAVRSFREAQRLDPECAMCFWGEAYALGPNVNDPITPEREKEAHAALQKAQALAGRITDAERGLIEALAPRYSDAPAGDRSARDAAFTAAMKALAARFPHDPEINTMYAAAAMEARPWKYWKEADVPEPEIAERARDARADDPGASGSSRRPPLLHPPRRGHQHARIAACRAPTSSKRLMPGAGHLVHMPAHIYMRVGRYADASESNVRAIAADEDYLAQCQAQGLYPVAYYPHNIHFLWAAATMEGRSAVASTPRGKVAAKLESRPAARRGRAAGLPERPLLRLCPLRSLGGDADGGAATEGLRIHHRDVALRPRRGVRGPRTVGARAARARALAAQRSSPSLKGAELAGTPLPALVDLAAKVLDGELASRERRYDAAIASLTAAVDDAGRAALQRAADVALPRAAVAWGGTARRGAPGGGGSGVP